MNGMSSLRTFWIAWCCFWALAWLLIGFFTFLAGWLLVPVSLLAILLPVGVDQVPRMPQVMFPVCPQCRYPHTPGFVCPKRSVGK